MASMATATDKEPNSFKEAMTSSCSSQWKAAAEKEMESLKTNESWNLIEPPANTKVICCK